MADTTTGYSLVSVPKQSSNQGTPEGKKNIVIIFDFDNVATYTRDAKGVRVTAFTLNAEVKPIGIFVDESTIDGEDNVDGEDYARGFLHDLKFTHPGSDIEFSEFKANNVNANLGAICIPCNPTAVDGKIYGTPCSPLKMTKADATNSKDKNSHEVELKSSLRSMPIGIIAKTLVPITDNATINTYLGLAAATTGV